jgi:O-antigen ligase
MNGSRLRRVAHSKAVWVPPRQLEYLYYFVISYSALAAAVNAEVPLVAAGLMTILAAFCFRKTGSSRRNLYAPIALLLACQTSYILVQVLAHQIFVLSDSLRWFILWTFATLIVQSLCLRPGFLIRCTIVIFAIGLIAVPTLGFNVDTVERARAEINIGGGLQNPDGLAAWFGFCAVSFGVAAMNMKSADIKRLLYWSGAIVSLFIVALTVSRATLLGCAVALTVASRHMLKRAFVPVLLFVLLGGLVFESGLINHITSNYGERATEETGRFLLWPLIVNRISESPLVGVGVTQITTYIPERGGSISTPHNSFLFFALSSGFVPFAFFLGFWIRAVGTSVRDAGRSEYGPFRVPLLLYALISFLVSDVSAETWSVLALAVSAGPPLLLRQPHPLVTARIRTRRLAQRSEFPSRIRAMQRKL